MQKGSNKILIITSGQPSLNPRLVKEADALSEAGNTVIVIYQYWNNWATRLDAVLLKSKRWQAIRVGGNPTNKRFSFIIDRVKFKLCRLLFKKVCNESVAIGAIARSSTKLVRKAKAIKADFYIGHNLGALPATVIAAHFNKKKCGFDAEDFHRYETNDNTNDSDVILKTYLENTYFPKLDYLTTASPLISEEYKKLFPYLNIHTILNVFPSPSGVSYRKPTSKNKLRLFWFSQTIGINRGLEDIINAIGLLDNLDIELHLLGNISSAEKEQLSNIATLAKVAMSKLIFYEPIDSATIIPFASQFDIGLATETGIPYNREICLTNKIFTYIQAGIAVVASDTKAQCELFSAYSGIGVIYKRGDIQNIASILEMYFRTSELLNQHRSVSLATGRSNLNWEVEVRKFIKIVEAELK